MRARGGERQRDVDPFSSHLRRIPIQRRSRAVVEALVETLSRGLRAGEDMAQLSVERLVQRAGVAVGSFYEYFANKDSLLAVLIGRLTRENFEGLLASVPAEPRRLEEVADALAAAVVRAYLDRPTQTRAAIAGIVRLDLTATVIAERDRFALELRERIAPLLPRWPEAALHSAVRDVCDAAMGVLSAELYRPQPRPPELMTRVVADLALRLLPETPPAPPTTERGHEQVPAPRRPDGGRHGA